MAFKYTIRSDGRLMKKVMHKKKSFYLYSYDPKDLQKQYIKLKNDLNNNKKIVSKNTYSVSEYCDYYYAHYVKDSMLSNKTKKDYADCIRLYIKKYLGKYKLIELTELDVNDMLQKMTKDGITRRREMTLQLLNSILKTAKKNNLVSENVAEDIKLIKHVPKKREPLSMDIINLILEMPNEDDSVVFMIKFIITTGIRIEEVSPIKISNINNHKLNVCDVVDLDSKDLKVTPYTKNKDTRVVPILDIIYKDLEYFIENKKPCDLLFPNRSGELKSRSSFKRDLQRYLKKLNIYYETKEKAKDKNFELTEDKKIKFTYHQLRYSYARLLHKAGVDLKEAQAFTGHKDLTVLLNIYTKLDKEDIKIASDKLNSLFVKS